MKRIIIAFVTGLFAGFMAIMVYMHKDLIAAAVKGEELPEAPEGCPAFKKKDE